MDLTLLGGDTLIKPVAKRSTEGGLRNSFHSLRGPSPSLGGELSPSLPLPNVSSSIFSSQQKQQQQQRQQFAIAGAGESLAMQPLKPPPQVIALPLDLKRNSLPECVVLKPLNDTTTFTAPPPPHRKVNSPRLSLQNQSKPDYYVSHSHHGGEVGGDFEKKLASKRFSSSSDTLGGGAAKSFRSSMDDERTTIEPLSTRTSLATERHNDFERDEPMVNARKSLCADRPSRISLSAERWQPASSNSASPSSVKRKQSGKPGFLFWKGASSKNLSQKYQAADYLDQPLPPRRSFQRDMTYHNNNGSKGNGRKGFLSKILSIFSSNKKSSSSTSKLPPTRTSKQGPIAVRSSQGGASEYVYKVRSKADLSSSFHQHQEVFLPPRPTSSITSGDFGLEGVLQSYARS